MRRYDHDRHDEQRGERRKIEKEERRVREELEKGRLMLAEI